MAGGAGFGGVRKLKRRTRFEKCGRIAGNIFRAGAGAGEGDVEKGLASTNLWETVLSGR